MNRLPFERYHDALIAETATLAEALTPIDAAVRIPTCPEWTVTDLAAHVGRGHRWAATMVEQRATAPMRRNDIPDGEPPGDPDARGEWLRAGARRLSEAVRDSGPDTPMWTWSDDDTAGFWLRRMTHDLVVHRFDAQLIGGRPGVIAADLAADGVTDLLTTWATLSAVDYSHQSPAAGLRGDGQSLRFHAIDVAGSWYVQRTPDGVRWRASTEVAGVYARGTARSLLLVLNRRLPPTRAGIDVTGDETLFTDWLAGSAF